VGFSTSDNRTALQVLVPLLVSLTQKSDPLLQYGERQVFTKNEFDGLPWGTWLGDRQPACMVLDAIAAFGGVELGPELRLEDMEGSEMRTERDGLEGGFLSGYWRLCGIFCLYGPL